MSPDTFRAMGVEVVVGGATRAELMEVQALFAARELVFSRFRQESELTWVNRAAAPAVIVSPVFARAVRTALAAAERTGGLVDPTLGAAIEAAGYDRDFAQLVPDPRRPGDAVPGRWRDLRIDGRLLRRPTGVRLDLNGVVKGAAVDEALRLLRGRTAFVSAGGDVAVRGGAVVGLPGGDSVSLRVGGLATSGTAVRRWLRGGREQHHLIDPRTGRPAASCWIYATAAASTCLAADVAAKAAFLLSEEGPDWLDEHGLPGRFVAADGSVAVNRSWQRALARGREAQSAA